MKHGLPLAALLSILGIASSVAAEDVRVTLDSSQTPALATWGEKAQAVLIEWHPRIANLLSSKDFVPPRDVTLILQKSDQGVGGTAGTRIFVSSHWVEKHPVDLGMVVHELTHVIQRYPRPQPVWVTEGIADYIRWAIYEGKPQAWFPVPNKPQGYLASYRVTAGFFLWLETDQAPGIVRRLNVAMRTGTYDPAIFENATGRSLDELWDAYRE